MKSKKVKFWAKLSSCPITTGPSPACKFCFAFSLREIKIQIHILFFLGSFYYTTSTPPPKRPTMPAQSVVIPHKHGRATPQPRPSLPPPSPRARISSFMQSAADAGPQSPPRPRDFPLPFSLYSQQQYEFKSSGTRARGCTTKPSHTGLFSSGTSQSSLPCSSATPLLSCPFLFSESWQYRRRKKCIMFMASILATSFSSFSVDICIVDTKCKRCTAISHPLSTL